MFLMAKYILDKLYHIEEKKSKHIRFGMNGRFKEHVACALKGSKKCPKIHKAMREHGTQAFICNTILICDRSDLNDFETYFIKYYKAYTNEGYNITIHNKITYHTEKKKENKKKNCECSEQK